ncbi:MAG: PQQ-dependent sugar dehydrogenase [Actinobacteria bacterium]|nr:PQQ-dependent sugar dehydrogenase [Actinomycetota bacterium]MCB8996917.1 PQQ-dependent sugar dehydrogenase [Actinomycetota bacterium]MCB9414089.1 PQQ-dependent sugar dehydrogenase [Actinomycetota bacterium]
MLAESLLALSLIDVKPVESGLSAPTSVVAAPNGTLFVTEKAGRIVKIPPKGKPRTWYRVKVSDDGEGGLLSMVRINSKRFYAAYTNAQGALQVSRFTKGGGERKIIRIAHPQYSNHNGGQVQLHKGLLYISTGDGGGSGDPFGAAGRLSDLRGKILRIDPTCGAKRYCIPASNPRSGSPVIASGLRNPWRFSIDATTNQIWIGDVGQNAVEEIDQMRVDAPLTDFGWSCWEGRRSYNRDRCDGRDVTAPILTYGRSEGQSVTGGYVYRGSRIPKLRGWYVFGDFGSGRLWAYRDGTRKRIGSADGVTSFGVDQRGELLLTTIDGRVLRIRK